MRVERSISLQEPAAGEMTISNPGDRPVGVKVSAAPYRSFQPGLVIPSAEAWLSFEPSVFTLAPGASTTVRYQVQPPEAIARDTAGEYLAAILIDQLPVESVHPEQAVHPSTQAQGERRVEGSTVQGSQITIVPRLAIPVYLQIRGREKVAAEISELKVSVYENQAENTDGQPPPRLLRIDTTLKSAGTVHVRPVGTFALFDTQKNTLFRAAPLGRTVPLLPSAVLSVPTLLPLPPAGKYRLTLTLEAGMPEPLQKETSFEITEDGTLVLGGK